MCLNYLFDVFRTKDIRYSNDGDEKEVEMEERGREAKEDVSVLF